MGVDRRLHSGSKGIHGAPREGTGYVGTRVADLTALGGCLHPGQLLLSLGDDAVDCAV